MKGTNLSETLSTVMTVDSDVSWQLTARETISTSLRMKAQACFQEQSLLYRWTSSIYHCDPSPRSNLLRQTSLAEEKSRKKTRKRTPRKRTDKNKRNQIPSSLIRKKTKKVNKKTMQKNMVNTMRRRTRTTTLITTTKSRRTSLATTTTNTARWSSALSKRST